MDVPKDNTKIVMYLSNSRDDHKTTNWGNKSGCRRFKTLLNEDDDNDDNNQARKRKCRIVRIAKNSLKDFSLSVSSKLQLLYFLKSLDDALHNSEWNVYIFHKFRTMIPWHSYWFKWEIAMSEKKNIKDHNLNKLELNRKIITFQLDQTTTTIIRIADWELCKYGPIRNTRKVNSRKLKLHQVMTILILL